MRTLAMVFVSCAADGRAKGTAECAAFDEPCPSECSNARERAYDATAKCWRTMRVACTKSPPVGMAAGIACCIRADGLVFQNHGGACLYTQPSFVGYRGCTMADMKGTSGSDCP